MIVDGDHQLVQGFVLFLPEHRDRAAGRQKSLDVLVRAKFRGHDLFSNLAAGDQSWPLRLVSRLAGSGLGYRRNTRPGLVYVRDEAAWLGSVRHALERHPSAVVIPAHGAPITENAASRTSRWSGPGRVSSAGEARLFQEIEERRQRHRES